MHKQQEICAVKLKGGLFDLQGKEAEVADKQTVVQDEESGTPVELGTADTGEGGAVGEASIVSGWDEAGNVLVRIAYYGPIIQSTRSDWHENLSLTAPGTGGLITRTFENVPLLESLRMC